MSGLKAVYQQMLLVMFYVLAKYVTIQAEIAMFETLHDLAMNVGAVRGLFHRGPSASLHVTTGVLVEALQALGAMVQWASRSIFSTQVHAAVGIARASNFTVCAWKRETLPECWWPRRPLCLSEYHSVVHNGNLSGMAVRVPTPDASPEKVAVRTEMAANHE